jgi:hypothetical protein
MIKEIICIGTSFTEGHGLNPMGTDEENPAVKWYKENKNIIIKSLSEYSWPNQLSEISGIKTRNLGKCGSSIEYLMRNVEEIIESEDCSDKLFILEYSSWGRSELWTTEHNQWLIANWGHKNGDEPSDGYATMLTTDYNFGIQLYQDKIDIYNTFLDNFFNESEFLLQRDRHFLNLLYKLKSKNINYQIIPLEGVYLKELEKNSLFNTNKLGIKLESLWDYVHKVGWDITSETNGKVEDGHPSISGHKKLAELLYEKIIKDKK